MENNIYDLIIIGTGPAGLTAAIYAKRAGLNFVVLKDIYSLDSQIVNTYEIENYTGFFGLSGQELYDKFAEHSKHMDIEIVKEKAIEIKKIDNLIKVITKKNEYDTKTVILATGANPMKLGAVGEEEFIGRGVSYCATCDGAFFKGKTTAVIGGGDVAVEDAIFLSKICKKVYVILRRDVFRATDILVKELLSKENVEVIFNSEVKEIVGKDFVENINIKNNENVDRTIEVNGVFIAVGINPNTELVKNLVEIDNGYVVADESCESSVSGIYACGDVRKKVLRQVITACSDGANAITSIQKYLIINKF